MRQRVTALLSVDLGTVTLFVDEIAGPMEVDRAAGGLGLPDYLPLCASGRNCCPAPVVHARGGRRRETPGSHRRRGRKRQMRRLSSGWGTPASGAPTGASTRPFSSPTMARRKGASLGRSILYSERRWRPSSTPRRPTCLGCATSFCLLPAGAALLFCLRTEGPADGRGGSLQKALAQLKERDGSEVYAFARLAGGTQDGERCEFFSLASCRRTASSG